MRTRGWAGLAFILGIAGTVPMSARQYRMAPEFVPPDLVAVGGGYEASRVYRLRRDAAAASEALRARARRDNVDLWIVSAYRSFDRQHQLYELQIRIDGPGQTTVARAGYSEHQLGEAVDFRGREHAAVLNALFANTAAGRWLAAHAPDFGFAVSYTEANRPDTGFSPEPWHYRYVGATAHVRHEAALSGSR